MRRRASSISRQLQSMVNSGGVWLTVDPSEAFLLYNSVRLANALDALTEFLRSNGYSSAVSQAPAEIERETGFSNFVVYDEGSKFYVVDSAGVRTVIHKAPLSIGFNRNRSNINFILNIATASWTSSSTERAEARERERAERAERARVEAEARAERERVEAEARAERERVRMEQVQREREFDQAIGRSKNPKRDRILYRLLQNDRTRVPSAYRAKWEAMVEKYKDQSPPYKLTPMETIIFEEVWNGNR